MATAENLKQALTERLQASEVEVIDTSGGCGASFEVGVISDQFEGKKLLQRHRLVNTALQEELQSIHALSIKRCWTTAQQRDAAR
ncbi:hypothetical protein WJX73_008813 [Symbiochloris irregularis]|uniref:BolA-like protein n=1 Tax=Symbiochloris irregularis TaxID=706552 RepID=A0AAW1P528_9CHLO